MMKTRGQNGYSVALKLGRYLCLSLLFYCGIALSPLMAQSTLTEAGATTQSTDAALYNGGNAHNVDGTGVDVGSVNATLEEALTYSKTEIAGINQGNNGYSDIQADIARTFYVNLGEYLGAHYKGNEEVSNGIVRAYAITKAYTLAHYDASHIDFLKNVLAQTVEDLQ